MTRLSVQVTPDHMKQLRGTPAKGLLELIKNALDADANSVAVTFERNALDGVGGLIVTDDGEGMAAEEIRRYFPPIGVSWKHRGTRYRTTSGRELFGRRGRGRFSAFSLGGRVTWTSVANMVGHSDLEPTRVRSTVEWADDEAEFDIDETPAPDETTGTRVHITDANTDCDRFDTGPGKRALTEQLAEYLGQFPDVVVTVDGTVLDYRDLLTQTSRFNVSTTEAKTADPELAQFADTATVEVLEWTQAMPARLWFTDAPGADGAPAPSLASVPARVNAPGLSYTARVMWDGMAPLAPHAGIEDMSPALRALMSVVRRDLRSHLKERVAEHQAELLEHWKAEGSYPYRENAGIGDTVTTAERELFDIVAITASPAFARADLVSRQFALRLLQQALRTDADALRRVLEQVLGLEEEQLHEIDELLQRTSLVSMIEVSKTATSRVLFCDWLESILNDERWRSGLRERGGLQELIEANTWIFGDQWHVMVADRGLRHAVVQLLPETKAGTAETVRDADGRVVRVDLLLAHSSEAAGRRQYLVIELKRPSHRLTKADVAQVDNYISTITGNAQFDDGRIDWTFVLVGNGAEDDVNRQRTALDRPTGLVDTHRLENGATYEFWVRTWAEVLADAQSRLKFVRDHLPQFPSARDLQALTEAHEHLLRPTSPSGGADSAG